MGGRSVRRGETSLLPAIIAIAPIPSRWYASEKTPVRQCRKADGGEKHSPTSADQFRYANIGPKTVRLGGAFAGLQNLCGVTYTDGAGECCYPVVFDTGASGMVMSDFTRDSLDIPSVPGVTYEDFGIGGLETFDVSQSTQLSLAPITTSSPDNLSTPPYSAVGTKLSLRIRSSTSRRTDRIFRPAF